MRLLLGLLLTLILSSAQAQDYGRIVYPTPLRDLFFGRYVMPVRPLAPPYQPPATQYRPPVTRTPVPAQYPTQPLYIYPYPRTGSATWQLVPLTR